MSSKNNSLGIIITAVSVILVPTLIVVLWPSTTTARVPAKQAGIADEFTLADWPMSKQAAFGRQVYDRYCVGCHGDTGRGDGAAAAFLDPLPRNFQRGAFKFRTTPNGKLPLAADIIKTITCGLSGSSMPEFRLMPEVEKKAVAEYVQHVATFRYGKREVAKVMKRKKLSLEQVLEDEIAGIKKKVWDKRIGSLQPVPVPPSPKVTPELLALGQKRYLGECNRCHGDTGRGDGGSSYTLRDWKDEAIVARDFTTGVFRAGSRPEDIFIRMRTGLNGTPMPSIPGSDEEIWALAHYILSLKDPNAFVNRVHAGCGLPGEHNDK